MLGTKKIFRNHVEFMCTRNIFGPFIFFPVVQTVCPKNIKIVDIPNIFINDETKGRVKTRNSDSSSIWLFFASVLGQTPKAVGISVKLMSGA